MRDVVTFSDEIAQPTINLPRAALRFAREVAYPSLDVSTYMSRLTALVDAARPAVTQCVIEGNKPFALAEYLFDTMGFRGNNDNYNDPENSYFNRVLDRRLGIPISLSLVYIAVAKRLGINAYGIGLPGHFIVGVYSEGKEIYLDPYNGGQQLTLAGCAKLVRAATGSEKPFRQRWLAPISPSGMLARMLTNLVQAYIQQEDWQNAIPVMQHLQIVQPESNAHLRDLGFLYMYNGSLRAAADYLEEYLRRTPDAGDYEPVRSSLAIVAGRLALWN